jgi:hypothetical protein
VHDETTYRRRLKYLIALDEYTREGLYDSLCAVHHRRRCRADTAAAVCPVGGASVCQARQWPGLYCQAGHRLAAYTACGYAFIAPGSPWRNGYNESFNGVFRDGCLNHWLFASVQEARRIINHWREGVQLRTTAWRPWWADPKCMRSAMQPPCCMSSPNIGTGRIILGLTCCLQIEERGK